MRRPPSALRWSPILFICGLVFLPPGPPLAARPQSQAGTPAAPAQPNSNPTYQQLRTIGLGSEAVAVHDLVLKRDAGTFTFKSGSIAFLAPVNGKVTGAVFSGEGSFSLVPPIAIEQHSLSLLTKEPRLDETFRELVLRFTDDTYSGIMKSPQATAGAPTRVNAGLLEDTRNALRKQLHYNLDARILADVLTNQPGGLFVAFIKGNKYSSRMVYLIDPHGAPVNVEPEEVALLTWAENKFGVWAAFHYSREYETGQASGTQNNAVIHIVDQQLDTQILSSGELHGKAATHFVARVNGLRVVPFDLFPTLRVQTVTDSNGQPLAFIQEDKRYDPDFWVILPKDLAAGEEYTITTAYGGKDAVKSESNANYYPVARTNWYPSSGRFDDFSTYEMSFTISKGLVLVATGQPLGEVTKGKQVISKWRSDQPQAVAGFQFGKFKEQIGQTPDVPGFEVDAYANTEPPEQIQELQSRLEQLRQQHYIVLAALGPMFTTGLLKRAEAEAQLAVGLYTDYFGPIGFNRLAITQQTAFNYGQSWPEMIWLPISYFYDATIRHQLGLGDPRGYFEQVAPHEVAHQWWGNGIGFDSYRDQWMSEGFSDFSASLYIQYVWKDRPQAFQKFWNDERDFLLDRNAQGYRAIDVGPVTLGYRLNNTKAGFNIAYELLSPKGAYILHMIRMMMWDQRTGDQDFKAMMHDFVKTYAGRAASTEDFKATVEKHMTLQMNIGGNGKMDWFFDEYVYGTALPTYNFVSSFSTDPDGTIIFNLKLAQSNVNDNFRMLVPIYLEFANGKVLLLGRAHMTGNRTVQQRIPLRGLQEMPRRALINYYDDVLCSK